MVNTDFINIFDSHAHYDDSAFNIDRDDVLDSAFNCGVCGIINAGSDIRTSKISVKLANKYPHVFAAVGIHPHEAESANSNYSEQLRKMLEFKKAVALGEIGLDYHYNLSPKHIQLNIFETQLKLAKELDIPVIIHDREAHMDTMTLLKKYRPKGVIHCFSGSAEMAKEIIDLGMYIGIGGAITFKNAKKLPEVVSSINIDKILLETDAPYMTPVPFRGKRNDSSLIPIIAKTIAELKLCSAQEVLDKTCENTMKLFNTETL